MVSLPTTSTFINIHSHHKAKEENEWVLRNAFHLRSKDVYGKLGYAVSVGLHPWHVVKDWLVFLNKMEDVLTIENVLAIGEIGIDKSIATPLKLQTEAFEAQLVLAEKYKKPVIIHAVRSIQDMLPFFKKYKTVNFIIHGFRGNKLQAVKLVGSGNVKLSFGKLLLQPGSKEAEVFGQLPDHTFFLETDNEPLLISNVYNRAALLRNCTKEALQQELFYTFTSVFKIKN